jgi:ketosteroid isomerase-like protein
MNSAAENQAVIETFYSSFQSRDHAGMIACYHPDVHFSDPVFIDLKGNQAKAMWHMLCERGRDLKIEFNGVQATDTTGRAHWEARYTFGGSGRYVHNIIDANFRFQDGKIMEHQDSFGLWRWTRQALGPVGLILGWTPMVQKRVRLKAMEGLAAFIAKHPEYS